MAGFGDYARDTRAIELEIERRGIALGIDWQDEVQVRALAREALEHSTEDAQRAANSPTDYRLLAKVDLFGLAGLMLKTTEEKKARARGNRKPRRRGLEGVRPGPVGRGAAARIGLGRPTVAQPGRRRRCWNIATSCL